VVEQVDSVPLLAVAAVASAAHPPREGSAEWLAVSSKAGSETLAERRNGPRLESSRIIFLNEIYFVNTYCKY
jgi:uroporphyrinogen-III synthase